MAINRKRTLIASGVVGLALAGAGISQAMGGSPGNGGGEAEKAGADSGESTPIVGPNLRRAGKVALAHTGGGTITATELGDEEGYYEIEVGQEGGGQVDVHLDRNFEVIDSSSDGG
jgi:uncharacterized protein (AIM24 family)